MKVRNLEATLKYIQEDVDCRDCFSRTKDFVNTYNKKRKDEKKKTAEEE